MDKLTVAFNGIEVGTLTRHGSGAMEFHYNQDWLTRQGARAISLSLPLSEKIYRGVQVYNFFDNLLPDNEAIRARIQARFRLASKQPFDLLASIGRDCIGAIQLYPENSVILPINQITAEPLEEAEIASLLMGYKLAPQGMAAETDDFRISLAGAQEKTALLWYREQWHRPQGSTPTSHIIKLPIGHLAQNNIDLSESSENEWLCLQIAKAFGFPVANAELARFGEQNTLVVERFDRRWSKDGSWLMRLPQEDFCQALGIAPALKYESDGGPGIADGMKLLLGSQQANQDRETFFRSQILFWLLAAIDGHAKNFSLFIEPGSAYRMTPLYDIISAYPLMTAGSIPAKRARMAMAVTGKNRHFHWATIQPRHFESTAQKAGYSQDKAAELMADFKAGADAVLTKVSGSLPANFPAHISDPIFDGIRRQSNKLPG